MNKKAIIICAALSLVFGAPMRADSPVGWEQHPEGVALAVTLSSPKDAGRPIFSIRVQIKNTSNAIKYFAGIDPMESEFEVFYENAKGARVPLRDYSLKPPDVVDGNIPPLPIKPGEVLVKTLDLTPPEAATIRGHLVICRVNISSREIGGYTPIESSPKILIGGQ